MIDVANYLLEYSADERKKKKEKNLKAGVLDATKTQAFYVKFLVK